MADVKFRNATNVQGNSTAQNITLPTVLAGDTVILLTSVVVGGAMSLSGAGSWFNAGSLTITSQVTLTVWTTVSIDGSESGATTTINNTVLEKCAAIAASYNGLHYSNPFGLSTPLFAQNTTSNTTSATSPSVSPVPNSWVLEFYTSKSSTNASYTTPSGQTLRSSVFGSGGGAVDLALFDSNGIVSSGGNQTTTLGTATGNKIAGTLVMNTALAPSLSIQQAVNRASVF